MATNGHKPIYRPGSGFPIKGWIRLLVAHRYFPHGIAGLCVVSLMLVMSWFWVERKDRFPKLPQGTYAGTMSGVFDTKKKDRTLFIIESTGFDEVVFMLLRPTWKPQATTGVQKAGGAGASAWWYPVIVQGPDARLRLIGDSRGDDSYFGTVKNLSREHSGSWELIRLEGGQNSTTIKPTDLSLLLQLKAETRDVSDQMSRMERSIPTQQKEIERLTAFVTEGDNLKARANQKFQDVKDELKRERAELAVKQREARELESKVALSQRVTSMGKLVSLGRESLEREGRWFESILKTNFTSGYSADELKRGEAIVSLRRQIALERERIYRLEGLEKQGQVKSNPERFGDVWEGDRR